MIGVDESDIELAGDISLNQLLDEGGVSTTSSSSEVTLKQFSDTAASHYDSGEKLVDTLKKELRKIQMRSIRIHLKILLPWEELRFLSFCCCWTL